MTKKRRTRADAASRCRKEKRETEAHKRMWTKCCGCEESVWHTFTVTLSIQRRWVLSVFFSLFELAFPILDFTYYVIPFFLIELVVTFSPSVLSERKQKKNGKEKQRRSIHFLVPFLIKPGSALLLLFQHAAVCLRVLDVRVPPFFPPPLALAVFNGTTFVFFVCVFFFSSSTFFFFLC